MIRRFESYVENNFPARNPCNGCGTDGNRHMISIFSAGLTAQHLLIYFCNKCMAKDSIVFEIIAKIFAQKAKELAVKGY